MKLLALNAIADLSATVVRSLCKRDETTNATMGSWLDLLAEADETIYQCLNKAPSTSSA